ncbi:MAG: alpha/beta hydrolase family esterase [Cyclobacteriaceae bacterium]
MKQPIQYITIILILLICGRCSDDDSPTPTVPSEPGTYQVSMEIDDLIRWYTLVIPERYDHTEERLLLFFFHGGGGSMSASYAARDDLRSLCQEDNWILVFPNGTNEIDNKGSGANWNAVHCCQEALANNVNDVGFVKAMIKTIESGLKIDADRVYATGFSNGAMFTHRLAAEVPELFAAVAPAAGTIGGVPHEGTDTLVINPTSAIPILLSHGMADTNVQYFGGATGKLPSTRSDFSHEESFQFWSANNNCNLSGIDTLNTKGNNGRIVERKLSGCDGKVISLSIENLKHLWPGLDDAGYDGTARIFEFLKSHSK